MQIGVMHLGAFFVGLSLLIGGAFLAGMQWGGHSEVETASAASALETIEFEHDGLEESIPAPEGAPLFKVLRVVDGDTIVIEVDGKSESVRMIGVDTPELNDSRTGVQCFAKEAAAETKRLVTGKNIRLEKDASQGDRDKYKRLLGYVFLEDGTFVNRTLIAGGFAHEYTYDQAYTYQAQFKTAEAEAKEREVGLWAPDTCSGTPSVPRTSKSTSQTAGAAAPLQPIQTKVVPVVLSTSSPTSIPEEESAAPHQAATKTEQQADVPPEPEPAPPASSDVSGDIICSRNAYNCTDFKTQKDAQKVYDQCGGVESDIHRLDKNKDGKACDSLP